MLGKLGGLAVKDPFLGLSSINQLSLSYLQSQPDIYVQSFSVQVRQNEIQLIRKDLIN